jgi:hypothetical protein
MSPSLICNFISFNKKNNTVADINFSIRQKVAVKEDDMGLLELPHMLLRTEFRMLHICSKYYYQII